MFARRLHQHPHSTRTPSFFLVLPPNFYDGHDEIAARKHRRGQWAIRPMEAGVCASLRLVGLPMLGFPQSSTGFAIKEIPFKSLLIRPVLAVAKSTSVSLS